MNDLEIPKDIKSAVATEVLFVIITVVCAIMGWWGWFAAMAFLSILVPLWMCAIFAMICAAKAWVGLEDEDATNES